MVSVDWREEEGTTTTSPPAIDVPATAVKAELQPYNDGGWQFVSNAPYNGEMGDVCSGATAAPDDMGVRSCGALLYYLTVIPVEQDGDQLWGSLEFNDGVTDWMGQTSQAELNLAETPEFQPDATEYSLPASEYDDLTTVTCDA